MNLTATTRIEKKGNNGGGGSSFYLEVNVINEQSKSITHTANRYVNVEVLDINGYQTFTSVQQPNISTVSVIFTENFTGKIILT